MAGCDSPKRPLDLLALQKSPSHPQSPPMEPPYPSLPNRLWDLPLLSAGVSGVVLEVSDSAVVKAPCGEENRPALQIERAIYARLGPHPLITKLLYVQEDMLVLERLQYPLRKRLWDFRHIGEIPPPEDILRWALQLTQALYYVHSCGVLQVDISAGNALLDQDDNIKLSDFAGSSIDGSIPTVYPSTHSQNPNLPSMKPSLQSEIFALGSMIYEVETTLQPYHDKSDSEIIKLFAVGDFPDTSTLMLGNVITSCWRSKYKDVRGPMADIMLIRKGRIPTQSWKKR